MDSATRATVFAAAAAAAAALFVVQQQQMNTAAMLAMAAACDLSLTDSSQASDSWAKKQPRRPGPIPKVITVRKKVQATKPSRPGKLTRPKVASVRRAMTSHEKQDQEKSK